MTPERAAAVLGVPSDADIDVVQRSWRTWVRLAHPDVGGDPRFFDELMLARDVLVSHHGSLGCSGPTMSCAPRAQRPALREVLHAPSAVDMLVGALLIASAIASVSLGLALPAWWTAIAMGATSSLVAVWWTTALITREADAGQRIVVLVCTWIPVVACQVGVALLGSVPVVNVLPGVAVPFVVVVALVDPGVGLLRRSNLGSERP